MEMKPAACVFVLQAWCTTPKCRSTSAHAGTTAATRSTRAEFRASGPGCRSEGSGPSARYGPDRRSERSWTHVVVTLTLCTFPSARSASAAGRPPRRSCSRSTRRSTCFCLAAAPSTASNWTTATVMTLHDSGLSMRVGSRMNIRPRADVPRLRKKHGHLGLF